MAIALISAAALAACTQPPAPVTQGSRAMTSSGAAVAQSGAAPANVEITQLPQPQIRPWLQARSQPRSQVIWQDTADIGVEPGAPAAPAVRVQRQVPKPVGRRSIPASFKISGNLDEEQPEVRRIEPAASQPQLAAIGITASHDVYAPVPARFNPPVTPRVKPRNPQPPRRVAVTIPRPRPQPETPEPVQTARTAETPAIKDEPAQAATFIDIPPGPDAAVSGPAPEAQMARVTPPAGPQTAVDESKKVTFSWPVTGPVISRFGPTVDGKRNEGINIAVREGARVRAAESGTVAYVGNELAGYGNLLLVRHDSGYVTAYAHNKDLLVKKGDVVSKGDVIALAGMSGSVDEPQLHFEVRKGVNALDPLKFLGRPGARG